MATPKEIREYFARFGRQGGKKAARSMTPEQRRESARRAARARWAKTDKTLDKLEATAGKITENSKALLKLNRSNSPKAKRKKKAD